MIRYFARLLGWVVVMLSIALALSFGLISLTTLSDAPLAQRDCQEFQQDTGIPTRFTRNNYYDYYCEIQAPDGNWHKIGLS